jgi:ferritin-like metal-binding protein YciE
MKVKSLDQLFETGLRYAYDSEQKLVKKGILSMIEAASSQELRSALEGHLQETIGHVTRLERIFGMIGAEPKAEDNSIMDEITKTAEKMVDVTEEGSALRDSVLITGGGYVEHHETAAYESLASVARQLGRTDAAGLLDQIMNEEIAAAKKLLEIGDRIVNPSASQQRAA